MELTKASLSIKRVEVKDDTNYLTNFRVDMAHKEVSEAEFYRASIRSKRKRRVPIPGGYIRLQGVSKRKMKIVISCSICHKDYVKIPLMPSRCYEECIWMSEDPKYEYHTYLNLVPQLQEHKKTFEYLTEIPLQDPDMIVAVGSFRCYHSPQQTIFPHIVTLPSREDVSFVYMSDVAIGYTNGKTFKIDSKTVSELQGVARHKWTKEGGYLVTINSPVPVTERPEYPLVKKLSLEIVLNIFDYIADMSIGGFWEQ